MGSKHSKHEKLLSALEGGVKHIRMIHSARILKASKLIPVECDVGTMKGIARRFPRDKTLSEKNCEKAFARHPGKGIELSKRLVESMVISERVWYYVGFKLEFTLLNPVSARRIGLNVRELKEIFSICGEVLIVIKQQFQHEVGPLRITTLRGFSALHQYLRDLWESLSILSDLALESQLETLLEESKPGCSASKQIGSIIREEPHSSSQIQEPVRGGLDKPKHRRRLSDDVYETEENESLCCICMERSVEYLLPCSHTLCQKCYDDWRKRQANCPTCRSYIRKEDEDDFWVISDVEASELEAKARADVLIHLLHDFMFCLPRIDTSFEELLRISMNNNNQDDHSALEFAALKRIDVPTERISLS